MHVAVAVTRWPVILAVVLAGVCAALHVGKVPPAIPQLRAEFGLGLTAAGWILSSFAAVGAVAAAVAGSLGDLLTPRRAMLGGLALLAAASLAGAAAPSGGALLALRFVESAAALMVVVSGPALIWGVVRAEDVRPAFALWGCWMPLGAGLMMLVSPLLLIHGPGWRAAWAFAAAASAAAGLLLWHVTRGLPRARAAIGFDLPVLVRRPGPWLLAVAFCVYSLSYNALVGFFPVLLVERLALAPAWAMVLSGLVVLVNVFGNLGAGRLARRGWPRWTSMVAAFLAMAATAPLVFSELLPDGGRLLAAAAFSALGGLLPATVLGAAALFAPRPSAVGGVNGFVVQGSNVGQLLGPPLLAAVVVAAGWTAAAGLIVAAATVGLAAALGLRRLEGRG